MAQTKLKSEQIDIDAIYPVGAVYISVVSTSPATLFGGTWSAFAEGRVLAGKAGSGTFSTGGATGGGETVTLTAAQSGLPSHNHNISGSTGSKSDFLAGSTADYGIDQTYTSSNSNYTVLISSTSANASSSHSNLQPYIVVYMWKRTA